MTETGPEIVDLPEQPVVKNGNGSAYLSPDEMEAGAKLEERDVEDVFGGKVRVRELTAAQAARIQQAAVKPTRGGSSFQMSIADAEVLKFQLGVIVPDLTDDQNRVMRLYQRSGRDFRTILAAIDELSGTAENAMEDAKATFPGPEEA